MATRPATAPSSSLLHVGLALTMGLGGFVRMEPAPYDLLLVAAIVGGPWVAWPTLRPALALPYLCGSALLLSSGVALVMMPQLRHGAHFLGVTAYLAVSAGVLMAWLDRFGPPLLRALLRGYGLGAGLTGGLAVAAYFGWAPGSALMVPDGRLQGLFKDANVFGAFMVPAVLLGVAGVAPRRGSNAALVVVGALAVLLSYSRGAWLNLALGLVTYAGLRGLAGHLRPTPLRVAAAGLGLLVMGGLMVLAFEHPAVSRMLEIRASHQGYDHDRFSNQAAVLAMGLEHPLGIGPGGTEVHFRISAHSLYIRALVESGLMGLWATLGLAFASLGRALWAALQPGAPDSPRMMAVVAASLAGAVMESLVIDTIHWRHLWILLALAWTPRGRARPAPRP